MLSLVVSAVCAFVFLSLNIGTSDVGGVVGTLVVPAGTAQQDIEQTRSFLRLVGFGWSLIAFGCLVWIVRGIKGRSYSRSRYHNVYFFVSGAALFGLSLICGLVFALIVGSDSVEFRRYFQYFIALWMAGCMLIVLGRPRSNF